MIVVDFERVVPAVDEKNVVVSVGVESAGEVGDWYSHVARSVLHHEIVKGLPLLSFVTVGPNESCASRGVRIVKIDVQCYTTRHAECGVA